jgi:predicted nucleic acid-binding protein
MLVLDANILIRAVLGKRVKSLLVTYKGKGDFLVPDVCVEEARRKLPAILQKRGTPIDRGMRELELYCELVQAVPSSRYAMWMPVAYRRLGRRDADDCPILACALALDFPLWTEDSDFFGCGIATWTTDRVEPYLIHFPDPEPCPEKVN